MRRGPLIALAIVAACTTAPGPTTTRPPSSTTTGTESATTNPATPGPTDPVVVPPCQAGTQPFIESGGAGVIEREAGDAEVLSAVRWSRYEGCDRIVIDFATPGGAPAVSAPGVGPLFIRSAGVLRLELDDTVSQSKIRDQVVGGTFVDHAYVVRRPGGEIFVDLHLGLPAAVRVSAASSPARLVVDAILDGAPYPSPPFITAEMVVIDPVVDRIVYPFTVNGYLLGGDERLTVTVGNGDASVERDAEVGQGPDTWGAFTVLVPSGPTGPASMVIGPTQAFEVDLG